MLVSFLYAKLSKPQFIGSRKIKQQYKKLFKVDREDFSLKNCFWFLCCYCITFSVVNQESVSMVVSRQFVTDLVEVMNSLQLTAIKAIANGLLSSIQSRLISYEEQVNFIVNLECIIINLFYFGHLLLNAAYFCFWE